MVSISRNNDLYQAITAWNRSNPTNQISLENYAQLMDGESGLYPTYHVKTGWKINQFNSFQKFFNKLFFVDVLKPIIPHLKQHVPNERLRKRFIAVWESTFPKEVCPLKKPEEILSEQIAERLAKIPEALSVDSELSDLGMIIRKEDMPLEWWKKESNSNLSTDLAKAHPNGHQNYYLVFKHPSKVINKFTRYILEQYGEVSLNYRKREETPINNFFGSLQLDFLSSTKKMIDSFMGESGVKTCDIDVHTAAFVHSEQRISVRLKARQIHHYLAGGILFSHPIAGLIINEFNLWGAVQPEILSQKTALKMLPLAITQLIAEYAPSYESVPSKPGVGEFDMGYWEDDLGKFFVDLGVLKTEGIITPK